MQGFLDQLKVRLVGNRARSCVANSKNVENDVVSAGKNVRAQDINWDDRKRAGDFGQQLFAVPSAEADDAVTVLGKTFPVDRRSQRLIAPEGYVLEKCAKKFKMPDNFGIDESAQLIVRHEVKMRFNFFPIIAVKIIIDRAMQAFTLDFCLFVVGFLVGEVVRRRIE